MGKKSKFGCLAVVIMTIVVLIVAAIILFFMCVLPGPNCSDQEPVKEIVEIAIDAPAGAEITIDDEYYLITTTETGDNGLDKFNYKFVYTDFEEKTWEY